MADGLVELHVGALNIRCCAGRLLLAGNQEVLANGATTKARHELLRNIAVSHGCEALHFLRWHVDGLSSRHDGEDRLSHKVHILGRLQGRESSLLGATLLDSEGHRIVDHFIELVFFVVLEEGSALLDGASEAGLLLVEDCGWRQSLHLLLLLLVELLVSDEGLLRRPVVVSSHLRGRGVQQSLVHLWRCEGRMLFVAQVIVLLEVNTTLSKIFVTSSTVVFYDIAVTTRTVGRVVYSLVRLAKVLRRFCTRDVRLFQVVTLGSLTIV